jgi:hypothetical protein
MHFERRLPTSKMVVPAGSATLVVVANYLIVVVT